MRVVVTFIAWARGCSPLSLLQQIERCALLFFLGSVFSAHDVMKLSSLGGIRSGANR